MSSRVTSNHIASLIDTVNANLEERNKPLRFRAVIHGSPTVVNLMAEGGRYDFSQSLTLREAYEALSLMGRTLANMDGREE